MADMVSRNNMGERTDRRAAEGTDPTTSKRLSLRR